MLQVRKLFCGKKAWEKKHAKQVKKVEKIITSISQEKLPEPEIVEETGEDKPIEEVLDEPMLTKFGES